MKKRAMGLLMAAAMTAGMSGYGQWECSAAEIDFDEEPYEATLMYWAANDARDVDSVEAAFNELTMAQLNMKVDLQPVTFGTYNQQIQMILSSDDPLDIFPMYGYNAATYINAEYVEDLSPYLDTVASDLKEIIGEEDIMCDSLDGFVWGVPTMHERCTPSAYVMRTDILEETGINAEDIKTTEDVTEVFAKVKELHPEITIYGGTNTLAQPISDMSYDPLGSGNFGVLLNYGQDTTVTNWFESDEYRRLVDIYYDWAQKGYSSADLATSADSGETLMRAGNLFCFSTNWKPNTKVEKDATTGYDTTVIRVTEPACYTNTTCAVSYAIASNTEDPEKAATLLNWIYKTKEANDLLNWGLEGTDYQVLEDGTIDYPEGKDENSVGYHQDFGWAQLNQFNSYVWTGNDADIWDQYQEMRDNAIVSKAYGFAFDATPVLDEISALSAVREQYQVMVGAGTVDPETGIAEFNEALYAAGLQDVIDEKQRQLDEWLADQE